MESKIERKYTLTLTEQEFFAIYHLIGDTCGGQEVKKAKPTEYEKEILDYLYDEMDNILRE